MKLALIIILAVVAIFMLVVYLLVRKDRREAERRRVRLFAPIEHRRKDRRRNGLQGYLAWATGVRKSKLAYQGPQGHARRP